MSYSTARRVDALGRIVLPAELRRALGIAEGDQLDIREVDRSIVLSKPDDACVVCGADGGLVPFRDRLLCKDCVKGVKRL
jgi:AbrB family transcriptional regulator, transcriptional pleiotropic regulator of transition state genes